MSGRGKSWEALLTATFEQLDECTIHKTDPPIRILNRTGGIFRAVFTAGGACDYEGLYRGVGFAIEAKDALASDGFGREKKIAPHQVERLHDTVTAGGVAALCLRLRGETPDPNDDVLWIVEWKMFETFPWTHKRVKPTHVRSAWSAGLGGKLAYGAVTVFGMKKWLDARVESRALARAV